MKGGFRMSEKGTVDWLIVRLSVGGFSAFKESLNDMFKSVGKSLSDEKCEQFYEAVVKYRDSHKSYKTEYKHFLEDINSLEF